MAERDIVVTEEDAEKLQGLLDGAMKRMVKDRDHLQ